MKSIIFTLKETADFLRISESRLRKMIDNNEITCFRNGYRIYFTEQAIKDYLSLQEKNNRGYELDCKKENYIRTHNSKKIWEVTNNVLRG